MKFFKFFKHKRKTRKKLKTVAAIVIMVLIPVGTFGLGYFVADKIVSERAPVTRVSLTGKGELNLTKYWKVLDIIRKKFYKTDLDNKKLADGSIEGLVRALGDRHSIYMLKKQTEDFEVGLKGKLEGIGAELTVKKGSLEVVSILKRTPAMKAGLRPKDIITKIDDTFTSDISFPDAIHKIRGPKGSIVKLTIARPNNDKNNKLKGVYEHKELEITRDEIQIDSVEVTDKGHGIYQVEVNTFSQDTDFEFRKALLDLRKKGAKGIVLDLRFNPGGYMNIAVSLASQFIKEGVIVSSRSRTGVDKFMANGDPIMPDIPLVVLVNAGSASASEILAGALQDTDRAKIIGVKTYGKGTVQQPFPFKDGTFLKITTAQWYTPKNRTVNEIGLKPDIEVKLSEDDRKDDKDPQLDRALKEVRKLIAKQK